MLVYARLYADTQEAHTNAPLPNFVHTHTHTLTVEDTYTRERRLLDFGNDRTTRKHSTWCDHNGEFDCF